MHSGSVAWVDSSTRTDLNRNFDNLGSPAPTQVVHITSAFYMKRTIEHFYFSDKIFSHGISFKSSHVTIQESDFSILFQSLRNLRCFLCHPVTIHWLEYCIVFILFIVYSTVRESPRHRSMIQWAKCSTVFYDIPSWSRDRNIRLSFHGFANLTVLVFIQSWCSDQNVPLSFHCFENNTVLMRSEKFSHENYETHTWSSSRSQFLFNVLYLFSSDEDSSPCSSFSCCSFCNSGTLSMFRTWLCSARKATGESIASRLLAQRRTT